MRKKETMAMDRMREWGEKKRRSSGENERKIIDKISSCSNILMQEIRL